MSSDTTVNSAVTDTDKALPPGITPDDSADKQCQSTELTAKPTPLDCDDSETALAWQNLKNKAQCQGSCQVYNTVNKTTGKVKGCTCNWKRSGTASDTTLPRQPLRKKARASKGLRDGRLREGTQAYEEQRQIAFDKAEGRCKIQAHPECSQIAEGVHHVKSRSRGGSDYATNFLAACNLCNGWVEDNPKEAHDRGFAKHFWEPENTDEDLS